MSGKAGKALRSADIHLAAKDWHMAHWKPTGGWLQRGFDLLEAQCVSFLFCCLGMG